MPCESATGGRRGTACRARRTAPAGVERRWCLSRGGGAVRRAWSHCRCTDPAGWVYESLLFVTPCELGKREAGKNQARTP